MLIGQQTYDRGGLFDSLENSVRDVELIAGQLADTGFEPEVGKDVDFVEGTNMLEKFCGSLKAQDEVVFYFAGHGIQFRGENYLMLSNAQLRQAEKLQEEALQLTEIIRSLSATQPAVLIIVLDCCRDAPPNSWLSTEAPDPTGLKMAEYKDVVIVYSAAPNASAADGPAGGNSPFASSFAGRIKGELELDSMLREVGMEVYTRTDGAQRPWWSASRLEPFYFVRPQSIAEASSPKKEMYTPAVDSPERAQITRSILDKMRNSGEDTYGLREADPDLEAGVSLDHLRVDSKYGCFSGSIVDRQGRMVTGGVVTGLLQKGNNERWAIVHIYEHGDVSTVREITGGRRGINRGLLPYWAVAGEGEGGGLTGADSAKPLDRLEADGPDGIWLFPDSSRRLLIEDDVVGLDGFRLWIARNEIFARHGYIFKSDSGKYLVKRLGTAYHPVTGDMSEVYARLNEIERKNVALIQLYENNN